jgi:hypothetical protein
LPDPFNFLGDLTVPMSLLFLNSVVECSNPGLQGAQLTESPLS